MNSYGRGDRNKGIKTIKSAAEKEMELLNAVTDKSKQLNVSDSRELCFIIQVKQSDILTRKSAVSDVF